MSHSYIWCPNEAMFHALERRTYQRLGYMRPSNKPGFIGKTKGEEVHTFRYCLPVKHPTDGSCLMVLKPVTCHHTPDLHTKDNPMNLPNTFAPEEVARKMSDTEARVAGFILPDKG